MWPRIISMPRAATSYSCACRRGATGANARSSSDPARSRLRTRAFRVQDQNLGPTLGTEVLEPRKAEAHEPVLVRDNEPRNLAAPDRIHQRRESLALEV